MLRDIIIGRAVEAAHGSEYFQKLGAVIFNKKTIISCGHNYKERSAKRLHRKYQNYDYSIHAEVDAILHAKRDLRGTSLLVVRVNNNGEFRLAKPCKYCMMYISHVGIKNIYYSISDFPYIVKYTTE